MMAAFVSSHHPITRQPGSRADVGPFLNVVTWILLIASALAVLTRLITKRALRRRIDVDDAFVVLALVCIAMHCLLVCEQYADGTPYQVASIGSGVAVSMQTANGLGRDISLLTDRQLVAYQKVSIAIDPLSQSKLTLTALSQGEYANKLLFIATLGFAKLSIISLLMILTASDLHRNLGLALTGFIALWGVLSVFVTAFQCGTVEPWRFIGTEHCLDLVRCMLC